MTLRHLPDVFAQDGRDEGASGQRVAGARATAPARSAGSWSDSTTRSRAIRAWVRSLLLGLLLCPGLLGAGPALALAEAHACGARGALAVQVLGSGGPELRDGRASSSYLIWVDDRARVLIDAGAGSMLRLGETGAMPADLWHVGLTHLHVDHSGDIAALVKAAFFFDRTVPLTLTGPHARAAFPAVDELLARLFGPNGAYAYLGGALDGSGGQFELVPLVADATPGVRQRVATTSEMAIEAIGVRHGSVPALGYRVDVRDHMIGFMGDQDALTPAFWDAVRDADVLIAHLAIADDADPVALALHATPERIARAAQSAGVRHLVLSHLMTRAIARLDDALAAIRTHYFGRVTVARDLACVAVW